MKDEETVSGVVYDYNEEDGYQSFKIRVPSSGEAIHVGFMDSLVGDKDALKDGEAIELTRLNRHPGIGAGVLYHVYSPNAELERTRRHAQKEKEESKLFWYVIVGFIVLSGAGMLHDAGDSTLMYILSGGFWILILYGIGCLIYAMFFKKPNK
jgi:hypothetical protein